jgi:hypothetical protein
METPGREMGPLEHGVCPAMRVDKGRNVSVVCSGDLGAAGWGAVAPQRCTGARDQGQPCLQQEAIQRRSHESPSLRELSGSK